MGLISLPDLVIMGRGDVAGVSMSFDGASGFFLRDGTTGVALVGTLSGPASGGSKGWMETNGSSGGSAGCIGDGDGDRGCGEINCGGLLVRGLISC